MTIQKLHEITGKAIVCGLGGAEVGVNLSSFPSPADEGIVMPAKDASYQWLEAAEEAVAPGHWLVIEG